MSTIGHDYKPPKWAKTVSVVLHLLIILMNVGAVWAASYIGSWWWIPNFFLAVMFIEILRKRLKQP